LFGHTFNRVQRPGLCLGTHSARLGFDRAGIGQTSNFGMLRYRRHIIEGLDELLERVNFSQDVFRPARGDIGVAVEV